MRDKSRILENYLAFFATTNFEPDIPLAMPHFM
jgi:hypothetical protein